jgi:NAD(P)H-hydrate epimerase
MPLPVITVEQMRAWEKASWDAGRSEAEVIQNVGRIVAEHALRLTHNEDRILVLAGKGHNGDDARAAVPHLLNRKVKTLEVIEPKQAIEQLPHLLEKHPRLVIDGLFGIGLNRPLSPEWVELIERINHARLGVLAIDVPSGFNAESGKPEGAAIEAAVTLAIGAIKSGMLGEAAWKYVGRLEVAPEIGLIPCPFAPENFDLLWSAPQDFELFSRRRPVSSHKGAYGHVAIIAGSLGYHGAAALAARGAQQAQPGLITLCTQAETYIPIASQLQSAMVHPWPPLIRLEEICSVLVVGPGLASKSLPQDVKTAVKRFWRTLRQPMIVDASALDWLDPAPVPPDLIRVVTPHPGEASRMLGVTAQSVQADRVATVRHVSERFGHCWVALKGHQTLVGRAKGPIYVNPTGNPYLAQGGSGDVLAGFVGGLLAQPAFQADPGLTLRYAVWAHGLAADRLSAAGLQWTIEELPRHLGELEH